MNPEENNPFNSVGASGADNSTFGSFDLNQNLNQNINLDPNLNQNPVAPEPTPAMSPADSLASVESNLNSMNMDTALNTDTPVATPNAFGAASSPSAASAAPAAPQFTAPETPLTPAAPIPGSIGSAMSAPASAELPVADTPIADAPAADHVANDLMTPVTEMGSLPPMNTAQHNTFGSAEANQAAPYNPFAQPADPAASHDTLPLHPNNASTDTSAAAAQPAFQPISATEATPSAAASLAPAAKATTRPASKLNLLLGIALAVTAIVAIVFIVLYINASNNSNKTISVAPITDNEVVQNSVKEITCELNREDGGNEVLTLNYLGDKLDRISIARNSFYDSEEAAQAERDTLESQYATNLNLAGLSDGAYEASFVADGTTVTATIAAAADQLRPEGADLLMLTTVDGQLDTSEESIRANYEAQGFVCSE